MKDNIRKRVGDGEDILFWYEYWTGDFFLKICFLRFFFLAINKEVKEKELCFWDGEDWKWVI